MLATVYGDVHDIGKNLVNTILTNNGYTVFDLGKQVPVNTILEKAEEVGADAIGLSALLVSTSKQMPLCAQELHRRGLRYPLLVGGAAINPSFVRAAARGGRRGGRALPAGDVLLQGRLRGPRGDGPPRRTRRARGVRARPQRGDARALSEKYAASAGEGRARCGPTSREGAAVPEADVPEPPFWGVKVLDMPVDEVVACIDLNTLYRMQWGAKNLKGEEWERLLRDDFEPRLQRYTREARTQRLAAAPRRLRLLPRRAATATTWSSSTPRERTPGDRALPPSRARRTASGSAWPTTSARSTAARRADVVALQVVTSGDRGGGVRARGATPRATTPRATSCTASACRRAEGAAEYVNRRIRAELGVEDERGLRYSWGYPACPDLEQHEVLFRILPARARSA